MTVHEKKSTLSIIQPRYSRLNFFLSKSSECLMPLFEWLKIKLNHFNGNTSYLTTSTLNTKYIWAVLIKLHDSVTYDDRRKSYEYQLIIVKRLLMKNKIHT
jgi:hypothetical protein